MEGWKKELKSVCLVSRGGGWIGRDKQQLCWELLRGPDQLSPEVYIAHCYISHHLKGKILSPPNVSSSWCYRFQPVTQSPTQSSCWEKAAGFLTASLDYTFLLLWLIIKTFVLTCKLINANWSQLTWEENYLWLQFGCKASLVFLLPWIKNWN